MSELRIVPRSSTITLYTLPGIAPSVRPVFSSEASQQAYFNKYVTLSNVDCSYVRPNGTIRIDAPIDSVVYCNYLSITNPGTPIRYYANIMSTEYINDNTTQITFSVDWFQTYMHVFEIAAPVQVERQHVTAEEKTKIQEDPWRTDVYQLLTAEDALTTSSEMYKNASSTGDIFQPELGDNVVFIRVADVGDRADEFKAALSGFMVGMGPVCSMAFVTQDGEAVGGSVVAGGVTISPRYGQEMAASVGWSIVLHLITDKPSPYSYQKAISQITNWLSITLLTSQILGMWFCPAAYVKAWFDGLASPGSAVSLKVMPMPSVPEGVDPKLLRFPYRFLEVHADGAVKEWQYEKFVDRKDDQIKFSMIASFDNVPLVAIAPVAYDVVPLGYDTSKSMSQYGKAINLEERAEVSNIPQVAYTTDSYLTYLGNQYASAMSGTTSKQYSVQSNEQGIVDQNNAATFSNLSTLWGVVSGTVSAMATGDSSGLAKTWGDAQKRAQLPSELQSYQNLDSAGAAQKLASTSIYKHLSKNYAANEYRAGSGVMLGAYGGISGSPAGWYLLRRQLFPEIEESYSRYLDLFGYSDGRITTPNIMNYITNGVKCAESKDGFTYCHTVGMQVSGVPLEAAEYISTMFNTGALFKMI